MIAEDKKRVYVTMTAEDIEALERVIAAGQATNYSGAAGVLLALGREAFDKQQTAAGKDTNKD